ncbi:MAG: hypothetical protein LWX11_09210 [Firmicutes bacterium]|nr:hypothetical protein [Bacillota bacterium]
MRKVEAAPNPLRHFLLTLVVIGAIHQSALWPSVQAILNTFLVLALAPEFRSPLVGAFWAAMAGWILEGTLRAYPHLGGTAFANLNMALLAAWTLSLWPPLTRKVALTRFAVLALIHGLLIHAFVRVACGPHPWGWAWLWPILTAPLWGWIGFKLHRPTHRR